jgi:peroxiredoxin (alkyl hydroperoxide reductase subunit C)
MTPAHEPLGVGDRAPDFTLFDQNGVEVSLSAFRGRKHVLLVFYPNAFSGICRGELAEIRDRLGDFVGEDREVLAISCDPIYSLRAWADAEGHFFPLLSDFWPHGEVARAYGVLDERDGVAVRGTFLVDPEGVIRWSLVNSRGEGRSFDGYRSAMAELTGAQA